MHVLVGFLVSRELTLTNTSEIPMTYRLRVSQPSSSLKTVDDGPSEAGEFQIIPESGTLPPNFHEVIQVHIDSCHYTLV